jgi:hypothetical protein
VGKAKADDKKRREAEKAKAKATAAEKAKSGSGQYFNPVFAEYDRTFAAQQAVAAKERAAADRAAADKAGPAPVAAQVGGSFAHLAERDQPKPAAPAAAGPQAAAAAPPKKAAPPKAPKAPKKPRVGVAAVAAGVDVRAVQETIAALQQRYAGNEASQVEVMADSVAKMFKEAQVGWGPGWRGGGGGP